MIFQRVITIPAILLSVVLFAFPFDLNKTAYVTAASGVRMRDKPSVSAQAIVTIPYGAKVLIKEKGKSENIDNKNGEWCRIEWETKKGWVFGGYLSEIEPDTNKYNPKTLAGYYEFVRIYKTDDGKSERVTAYIELEESGSFKMSCIDDWGGTQYLSGTFRVAKNILFLKFGRSSFEHVSVNPSSITELALHINSVNQLYLTHAADELSSQPRLHALIAGYFFLDGADGLTSISYNRTQTRTFKEVIVSYE